MIHKQHQGYTVLAALSGGMRFFRLSWIRMMVALFILILLTAGLLLSYSRNRKEPIPIRTGEYRSVCGQAAYKKRKKGHASIVKIVKALK